jgi:acetyltransferase-like isoleucine patch superfamily enzyme
MIRIIKLFYYRIIYFTKNVYIDNTANIGLNSVFSEYNVIGKYTYFKGVIGRNSYISENSKIIGKVGKFCSIGSSVQIITGRHPISTFVSTSPVFYSLGKQTGNVFVNKSKFKEFVYADIDEKYQVIIDNDVWIGDRCSIIGGITISDGAIVLAGSMVTKDVPPYAIVAGIPAKIIKYRFKEDEIVKLMDFKWWDNDFDWIKNNIDLFEDIENFLNEIG